MKFVSYAQNFEDVILWRAFKHVERGRYVDIGAQDPQHDSVTKAFYDQGWSGINVDPVPAWFNSLQAQRPRDINLNIAIDSCRRARRFFEIPSTGLSTFDEATAERHWRESGYQFREIVVETRTLAEVFREYDCTTIHFLKIDAEGGEAAVLEGADFNSFRPWVVLVEATMPNTSTDTADEWEPLLTRAGYDFVYFDGLNRFYLAQEHPELRQHFEAPPNVFDHFSTISLEAEHEWALASNRRADLAEAQVRSLQSEVKRVAAERDSLTQSLSWRVTLPLRVLAAGMIKLTQSLRSAMNTMLHRMIDVSQRPLLGFLSLVQKRPTLAKRLDQTLQKAPGLHSQLARLAAQEGVVLFALPTEGSVVNPSPTPNTKTSDLTPRGEEIYADLLAVARRADDA